MARTPSGSSRDRRRARRASERETESALATIDEALAEAEPEGAFATVRVEFPDEAVAQAATMLATSATLTFVQPDTAANGTATWTGNETNFASNLEDQLREHFGGFLLETELAPDEEAAPPPQRTNASRVHWSAVFAPEGSPTDDGRIFAPGSIRWRDLPLTLMAMLETRDGHDGARVAGKIERIYRAGDLILADGYFDEGDYGQEIARLVGDGVLRGLSVDLAIPQYATLPRSDVLDGEGGYVGPVPNEERGDPEDAPSLIDILFGDEGEDIMFVVLDGVIGAATVCPFPAFGEATISLASSAASTTAGGAVQLPDGATWRGHTAFTFVRIEERPEPEPGLEFQGLTASAAGLAPAVPSADWFQVPEPDGPCPITVEEDGRIYGHAAVWGTCHIGIQGVCVEPPTSETDYALFQTGYVVCDDGSSVPVGTVTLDTGHADRRLNHQAAAAHYDNTGTAVAQVTARNGEHGIWVCGALLPGVSAEQARTLRGASLSGDWRDWEDNLELVALLAVNVPGFPVPRVGALVAAGTEGAHLLSLTAAGIAGQDPEAADRVALEQIRALGLAVSGELDELTQG